MAMKPSSNAEPSYSTVEKVVHLDGEAYREFLEDLENPPPPNEALKTLMKRTPPWR